MHQNCDYFKKIGELLQFKIINNVFIYHPNRSKFYFKNLDNGTVLTNEEVKQLNEGIVPDTSTFEKSNYFNFKIIK